MAKIATIIPNRLDLRLAGDNNRLVNLQFHKDEDHVDVIFNRQQIPLLIEQLQTLQAKIGDAQ